MKELKDKRESYGGDERAINKHSVRIYEHEKDKYLLDQNLSGVPPFFTLSKLPKENEGIFGTEIKCKIKTVVPGPQQKKS
jgi:hypothetical protein